MASSRGKTTVNLFRESFKISREKSKDIYKGFGFKHLSDATQYYVHPRNQSFNGNTTLCQPIGESIILFATMLREAGEGNLIGDFYSDKNFHTVFIQTMVPGDYRMNGVVEENVYKYCAVVSENRIRVGAYDRQDVFLKGSMDSMQKLYKMLPAFLVLLAQEVLTEADFHSMMQRFSEKPVADVFVNLHEDFYQAHKLEEYEISYEDILPFDTSKFIPYSSSNQIFQENKKKAKQSQEVTITPFPRGEFTEEQLSYVPHLSEEFVLPENLGSVCNALANGDMLAVLFHGPAGTGKTISCKLVCQAIGLPIMETINCTENLDEFVLGKYIPQDDKIIFKESYVTRAIREGGAVVFEEINFAKPQYLAFLNSLLDDNGFVRLDSGEVVKRHPNFRFFATMNLGYFGTKELNQALYNRFNSVVEVAALSDEAISRMLLARVPESTPMVTKILGVYHKLKKKIESEELDVVISPRNLENWAKLAKYDGYIKAAEKTIIPIAKCDRALEDTIRGIMMLYKWE